MEVVISREFLDSNLILLRAIVILLIHHLELSFTICKVKAMKLVNHAFILNARGELLRPSWCQAGPGCFLTPSCLTFHKTLQGGVISQVFTDEQPQFGEGNACTK